MATLDSLTTLRLLDRCISSQRFLAIVLEHSYQANSSLPEWNLDSIVENDKKICEKIKGYFQAWLNDYDSVDSLQEGAPIPTEEELEMMRRLRERGLI